MSSTLNLRTVSPVVVPTVPVTVPATAPAAVSTATSSTELTQAAIPDAPAAATAKTAELAITPTPVATSAAAATEKSAPKPQEDSEKDRYNYQQGRAPGWQGGLRYQVEVGGAASVGDKNQFETRAFLVNTQVSYHSQRFPKVGAEADVRCLITDLTTNCAVGGGPSVNTLRLGAGVKIVTMTAFQRTAILVPPKTVDDGLSSVNIPVPPSEVNFAPQAEADWKFFLRPSARLSVPFWNRGGLPSNDPALTLEGSVLLGVNQFSLAGGSFELGVTNLGRFGAQAGYGLSPDKEEFTAGLSARVTNRQDGRPTTVFIKAGLLLPRTLPSSVANPTPALSDPAYAYLLNQLGKGGVGDPSRLFRFSVGFSY